MGKPTKEDEIIGENQERNKLICDDYIAGYTPEQIVVIRQLDISARRVEQIIFENDSYVGKKIAWPKTKRIHMLQRKAEEIKDKPLNNKDVVNVLEQIRKEVEGDKPLIDQSQHVQIIYSWGESTENNSSLHTTALPETNSRIE